MLSSRKVDSSWRIACCLFIRKCSRVCTYERTRDSRPSRGRSWQWSSYNLGEALVDSTESSEVGSSMVSQIVASVGWPTIPVCPRLKRHFTKEEIQIANKCMKRSSSSIVIRKIQIWTTRQYYCVPSQMAKMRKTRPIVRIESNWDFDTVFMGV